MTNSRLPRLLLLAALVFGCAWLLTPPRGAAFAPAPVRKEWGKEFKNALGMRLVRVPAGKFKMGSPPGEAGHKPDEGPVHEVEITKPFYLGAYEVTQGEFVKVMKTNPSKYAPGGVGAADVKGVDTTKLPVESVTWDEAAEFCKKLSALPAEKAAGRVYRLPSEAEWEYACRAGTSTTYHFGATLPPAQANFLGGAAGPGTKRTMAVGSYKANAFGLYDMHGNVQEMVADWFHATYYSVSPKKDPAGPANGTTHVRRGGSCGNVATNCRAATRFPVAATFRRYDVGFRVACSPAKGK